MHPAYVAASDHLREMFRQRRWAVGFDYEMGDGIVRSRNRSIARMRAHPFKATHFGCIDDDIQYDPRDLVTMIEATLAPPSPTSGAVEVIGGVYPKKLIDWHAVARAVQAGVPPEKLQAVASPLCCNFQATAEEIEDIANGPQRGIAELDIEVINDGRGHHFAAIKDLPTGFMVCRSEVFEKMIAFFGDSIAYTPPPDATGTDFMTGRLNDAPKVRWHKFFHMDTWENNPENDYVSEDWWFARMWQKMGGKTWAFAECRLIHHGSFAYSGCVADQLVLGGEDDKSKGQPEEDARASQASAE